MKRIVIWFSDGVTSAIAGKIAADKYRGLLPVHLVKCDTGSEHEDNWRFGNEVARWLELPLEVIRNEKYANCDEVYHAAGFFKNQYGARCTLELKKVPRRMYENLRTDIQVFGYDADEQGRADLFVKNNPEVKTWFPLIEAGINKDMARQMLAQAGIVEPLTYSLGFKNANCLAAGCVKGGMGYWNHIRRVFPDVFWRRARLEREIGYALLAREERGPNGERVKIPVYLDELDPQVGNYDSEPAFQCGLFCGGNL